MYILAQLGFTHISSPYCYFLIHIHLDLNFNQSKNHRTNTCNKIQNKIEKM